MPTYKVYESTGPSGPWTAISGNLSSTSFHATGRASNTGLWYRVDRLNDNSTISSSNVVFVVTTDVPTISATGGISDHITVSWGATCATKYNVYRLEGGTWVLKQSSNSLQYLDYAVSLGVTYQYRVKSVSSDGYETGWSNLASASIVSGGIFMATSRATIYQGIQMGAESTPGTAVAATKRIIGFSELIPKEEIPVKTVKAQGRKLSTGTQRGMEHTSASFNASLDYNYTPLILDSMVGAAAVVSSGTGNVIKTRTYAPSDVDPLTPKAYTVEVGSSKGAEKFAYAMFTGIEFKLSQEEASIQGSMIGGKLIPNASMTSLTSSDEVAAKPVNPVGIAWYISTDEVAFTQLNDVLEGTVKIDGLWAPSFHQTDATETYDRVKETAPTVMGSVTFENGSESETLVGQLRTNTKVFLRFKVLGPAIDTGFHKIQGTFPMYVVKPDRGDKNDVVGNTIEFDGAHDASSMFEIVVVNTLATIL